MIERRPVVSYVTPTTPRRRSEVASALLTIAAVVGIVGAVWGVVFALGALVCGLVFRWVD